MELSFITGGFYGNASRAGILYSDDVRIAETGPYEGSLALDRVIILLLVAFIYLLVLAEIYRILITNGLIQMKEHQVFIHRVELC